MFDTGFAMCDHRTRIWGCSYTLLKLDRGLQESYPLLLHNCMSTLSLHLAFAHRGIYCLTPSTAAILYLFIKSQKLQGTGPIQAALPTMIMQIDMHTVGLSTLGVLEWASKVCV